MIPRDVDDPPLPVIVLVEAADLDTTSDVVVNPLSIFEDTLPISRSSVLKLFVADPLATQQISQDGDMGRIKMLAKSAIDMCKVVVVAQQIQLLAIVP